MVRFVPECSEVGTYVLVRVSCPVPSQFTYMVRDNLAVSLKSVSMQQYNSILLCVICSFVFIESKVTAQKQNMSSERAEILLMGKLTL